jgi:glutamyl-tRNA synthetase
LAAVRCRFAPSPTGFLHVGGARSALYNWLFVAKEKKQDPKSSLLLRIEDTDEERNRPELISSILDSLLWLGITWDEGPYFQSKNKDNYLLAATKLIDQNLAYWCKCSPEEIATRTQNKGYDGYCRELNLNAAPGRVLRFKVPSNQTIVVNDLIRGQITINTKDITDFAILKSEMKPLFILANVSDDITMNITHVIRGEEHLTNTFKYVLIWEKLTKSNLPLFAHLPLIVDSKRQKLSKRKDNVAVEYYREQGYLAKAMVNYLALLGWGPKDKKEILEIDELVDAFNLSEVNKAPAFFDEVKLKAINSAHIHKLSQEQFLDQLIPFFKKEPWWPNFDKDKFFKVANLVQQRCNVLLDAISLSEFLYSDDVTFDEDSMTLLASSKEEFLSFLKLFVEKLQQTNWDKESIHELAKKSSEELGLKLNKTQAALRIAITGKRVGIPLFEALEVLGIKDTTKRINKAILTLEALG